MASAKPIITKRMLDEIRKATAALNRAVDMYEQEAKDSKKIASLKKKLRK